MAFQRRILSPLDDVNTLLPRDHLYLDTDT